MDSTTTTEKKLLVLDKEIRRFDTILVEIQERMPEEFEFYERIVNVRDAMYRLKACMRNCIIEYPSSSSPSPASDVGTASRLEGKFHVSATEESRREDDDDYVTIETPWFIREEEDDYDYDNQEEESN